MNDLEDFILVVESLSIEPPLDSEVTSILCAVASRCTPETQLLLTHLGWDGINFVKPVKLEYALAWLQTKLTHSFVPDQWLKKDIQRDSTLLVDPPRNGDGAYVCCYDANRRLYKTISEYLINKRAGFHEPATYSLLVAIQNELTSNKHPYAAHFRALIRDLPKGGMMIGLDDYEWLFGFLNHVRIFYLNVRNISSPPKWVVNTVAKEAC